MSYLSDFEHHQFEAQVYPDFVVQTHYVSDPITGQRRVPKEKVWKVERLLGKGGFGEVRLEVHQEENEKRAVKRMWATGSSFKRQYERELKALLEFSKPKYKESAVLSSSVGLRMRSVYIWRWNMCRWEIWKRTYKLLGVLSKKQRFETSRSRS